MTYNQPQKVWGEYPQKLYRIFNNRDYANNFINGQKIRLSSLSFYKNIEDNSRQDETEGKGSYQYPEPNMPHVQLSRNTGNIIDIQEKPGIVQVTSIPTNPIFILCLSDPPKGPIGLSPTHFGKWLAIINNPKQFAQDLSDRIRIRLPQRFPIECHKIQYNKDNLLHGQLSSAATHDISFSQKPSRFSSEYEYRFVTTFPADDPDKCKQHIYIDLKNKPDATLQEIK